MSYNRSVVMIVAADDKEIAETFGASLGHSGAEYAVPLSADGSAPASHFALHSWARAGFIELLEGAPPPASIGPRWQGCCRWSP
jgi:hypothetical protein